MRLRGGASRWIWGDVYAIWRTCMDAAGISRGDPFTYVRVHDPWNPQRNEIDLRWWIAADIHQERKDLQRYLSASPHEGDLPAPFIQRRGEIYTINNLFHHRNDDEKPAAVLIAASLYPLLGSMRTSCSLGMWPEREEVEALEDCAYRRWGRDSDSRERAWSAGCTQVVPGESLVHSQLNVSKPELIEVLADQHAAVLREFILVAITFDAKPDPFLAAELRHEKELQQRAEKEALDRWEAGREARERAEADRLMEREEVHQQRKEKHPRYDEWSTLSANELRHLVWSAPTTKIAGYFGVSDSAINKACARMGVTKPQQGFWNKVAAGKLPHPQGTPVASNGTRVGSRSRKLKHSR